MPQQERLYYLFDKYIADTATADELHELKLFLNDQPYDALLRNRLVHLLRQTEPIAEHSETRWQGILQQIREEKETKALPEIQTGRRITTGWWRVAAAVLLVSGTATWFFKGAMSRRSVMADQQAISHDRPPGGNVARLTLADGSTITLDSAQNGLLAQQGNAKVTKLSDGRLAYKALDGASHEKPSAPVSNTLSTPRGGQYRLMLPDGSEVWLNAASSITYPSVFTGRERKVSITGEVYFEIKQDASMPFRVTVHVPAGEQHIDVLGTHFNVKAYEDEPLVTTTLLEGSIRLTSKGGSALLQPGGQGQSGSDGVISLDPHANIEQAMAWKNGLFHFEHSNIREVMRQIARWYDVEVVFEGKVPDEPFDGEITRNNKLSDVLKILQLSNVHFKVEDKKVTVLP